MSDGPRDAEKVLSTLRHELRGIFAPAMLSLERLAGHSDPEVVRIAQLMTRTIERAVATLEQTRQKG